MKLALLGLLLAPLALPGAAAQVGPTLEDPGAAGETDGAQVEDLTELSLDELFDLEVTVVSRSGAQVRRTPAAVYVITGDEIRRSGHSSLPEVLRMVPGFFVSRWTTLQWDVTSRGFGPGLAAINSAYLNQLLVLVDGVVVYTPLFAGVWWPLLDMDLGDVDRIEIVRGPAGVMWGANAIHGIVHVITKSSADTTGWRTHYRAGTRDHHAAVRYGGVLGERSSFRAWVNRSQYTANENPFLGLREGYTITSAGLRADWENEFGRRWTAWSRVYDSGFDQIAYDLDTFEPYVDESPKEGQTVFLSTQAPNGGGVWQAWYTRDVQDIRTYADIDIQQLDLEYRRDIELSDANTLSLGAGYRHIDSKLAGDDPFYLDYEPSEVTQDDFRVFAYDTLVLAEHDLELSLGLQAEYTEFTDLELQPTARAAWNATEHGLLWGGITRAVRTPSLEDRTLTPESFRVGSEHFESEELVAYELGYRHRLGPETSYDLSLFFNEYDDQALEVFDEDAGEWTLTNEASGESYGVELAVDYRITEDWRIRSAYSYLVAAFEDDRDGSALLTGEYSPKHAFNLRSYYDLGADWELDLGLYAVEGLGELFEEAEYWRTDARLAWRPSDGFELAVGVQNATDPEHSEFDEFDTIRRAFYVSLTLSR